MKFRNTLQRGSARFIIFKEGGIWYGACLEFNIVEEGSTPQEAMLLLFDAAEGYLEAAKKIKARPHILNQTADGEYETLWRRLEQAKSREEKVPSVFSHGTLNLSQLRERAAVPV